MNETRRTSPWLDWAVELQAMGQAGLTYSEDPFDRERFQRLRDIAAEMLSYKTELPLETVKDLFCCETGYQTPKLDTRAAIIQDGKILLVRENTGKWSLPGGWVDVNVSVMENVVKEAREEAGLEVAPWRVVAVQDREKHNRPVYAWKVCKIFVLCTVVGGEFQSNIETTASEYFSLDELPPLAEEKTTEEQIRMCFDAYRAGTWETVMD
ncbi:NUDIX hydrolase [uncultured Oscillibacter sp.]|uniref:NUDIX hydrolase N-terminal domain-containing protein n=1 Tax=uncultured Oscillibacter sp. TaxID=876091 RepID=UPI0025DE495C|nr:NUDIX hydrolase [uncultured Oscillibacter sp.]